MNTLVGLGALSSFAVSTLAAFMPKLVNCKLNLLHGSLIRINKNMYINCCKKCVILSEAYNFIYKLSGMVT